MAIPKNWSWGWCLTCDWATEVVPEKEQNTIIRATDKHTRDLDHATMTMTTPHKPEAKNKS